MSANLLELIKEQVTGQLAKQASAFLGETEKSVVSSLDALNPVLLDALVKKSESATGAQKIMDEISRLDVSGQGNVHGLFEGGASKVNVLLHSGDQIVELLLGNKAGGILDLISDLNGIKRGSASTLLKLAAPFVLGLIGKQVEGKGTAALTDFLVGQKSYIETAMPAGSESTLQHAEYDSALKQATPMVAKATATYNNSRTKWILPVLLICAILYWLGTKGCGKAGRKDFNTEVVAADSIETDTAGAGAEVSDTISDTEDKLYYDTLDSGFELSGAIIGGIENQLISFIADKNSAIDKNVWFNFDRLLFDTNKASLQKSSFEQLKNVAEIMKAYPSVHIKIGGYTDGSGDPKANQRLSTDRAFQVMEELIKMGITESRMRAEGFGDTFPAGENTTEPGRQKNRSIYISVTKK